MNEFQCLGPVKEKARSSKVFVFVREMRKVFVSKIERSCLDGQTFRQIEWVSFRERIVAQD